MIEVVVNSTCPACTKQLTVMSQNFQPHEYKVMSYGSKDFQSYDLAKEVTIVPYISVRSDGRVTYKSGGYHTFPMLQKALKSP